jgi:alpha-ketoglutarate-dependent taurine dioxygenase
MFANMYAAYETLSPKLQQVLDGLDGVHDASLIEGLDKRGPEVVAEFKRRNPPVVHPAVIVHPDTGRKALYVNERVRYFEGMTEAESKPLIRFLCEHAVAPRRVYRHLWSVGDLVIWDNRCLMHMAIGDYDPAEIRHMFRTSSRGERVGRLADPGEPDETVAAQGISAPAGPEARQVDREVAALGD